jgi:hypothetical protein
VITAVVHARYDERGTFAIRDLSATGARLVGQLRLAEGERVKVEVDIEGQVLVLTADVVRTDPQTSQIAVAFRDVSAEDVTRIERVVNAELDRVRTLTPSTVLVVHPDAEQRAALERDLARLGVAATGCGTLVELTWQLGDRAVRHETVIVSAELADHAAIVQFLAQHHAQLRRVIIFGDQVRSLEHPTSGLVQAILRTPWHLRGLARALDIQEPTMRTYDMLTAVTLDDES